MTYRAVSPFPLSRGTAGGARSDSSGFRPMSRSIHLLGLSCTEDGSLIARGCKDYQARPLTRSPLPLVKIGQDRVSCEVSNESRCWRRCSGLHRCDCRQGGRCSGSPVNREDRHAWRPRFGSWHRPMRFRPFHSP